MKKIHNISKKESKQETLDQKLENIVSKQPSKFWEESDDRIKEREQMSLVTLICGLYILQCILRNPIKILEELEESETNNMGKTAVEFLVEALPMVDWEDAYYIDILEKAKEIEDEQKGYSDEDFKLFARQYYREIKLDKSNLEWDVLADKCFEQFKRNNIENTAVEFLVEALPMVDWEDSYYIKILDKAIQIEDKQKGYSNEDLKLFSRQYYRKIKLDKSNLQWVVLADKCFKQFKNKQDETNSSRVVNR